MERDGPLGRGGSSRAGRKAMPAGGSSAPGFGRRHPPLRIADPGLRFGNSALRRADPALRIGVPAFRISVPASGDGAAAREKALRTARMGDAYLFMDTLVTRSSPPGHPAETDYGRENDKACREMPHGAQCAKMYGPASSTMAPSQRKGPPSARTAALCIAPGAPPVRYVPKLYTRSSRSTTSTLPSLLKSQAGS
jgi:hypothetical protein